MRILPFLIAAALLSSCAYSFDKQYQDITVLTPGAENAICYVVVDGLRYRLHPPQTASIFKSGEDLVVDCMAPGNRRNKVVIEPRYADSAGWNIANAGAGLPWDFTSGALFQYPDIVEVSFIGTPVKPQSLPAQNDPSIKQPDDYPLEEFSPGQPRLNEDQNALPVEIVKTRGLGRASSVDPHAFSENKNAGGGKSDLQNSVEIYGDAINPGENAPTPLVPGQ